MSVIQKIRDKYARIAVIAIAVALIGFILTDYISGRSSSLFRGGNSTTIGRVNGKKIDIDEFRRIVKQQEDNYQQRGMSMGESERQRVIEETWNSEVTRTLLYQEADKLGMMVVGKELDDILFGNNPPEDFKRQFTDEKTKIYDANAARQQVNALKKRGTAEQKSGFNLYLSQLEDQRLYQKYSTLLSNSINFPKWFIEKQNADKSLMAKISYVKFPLTDPSFVDSTIKVSDKEIQDYIDKHKEDFKQEKSRSIEYVSFSTQPSAADTSATKTKLESLRAEFDTTKDVKKFLENAGTEIPYDETPLTEKRLSGFRDSVTKKPIGGVYGPYPEGNNLVLGKLMEVLQIPEKVKVRHILVSTASINPMTGESTGGRDTAAAKKLIDSLQGLIKAGANFDSVCFKFSEDPGRFDAKTKKFNGGVYDSVKWGGMVTEFNNFIFLHKTGEKGVVKTQFGYHYIEILSQTGSDKAYRIAYLAKPVESSRETDENANNEANRFASSCHDVKSFDEVFEKELKPKGFNKLFATNIKPEDYSIVGIGSSREFVRKIYDASRGKVLDPEPVEQQYVVAVITEINDEGTQSVAKARSKVEPLIRNHKKAEMAKQKFGKITTLEAAAAATGKTIETVDSVRVDGGPKSKDLAFEPRILGLIMNLNNQGKIIPEAIEGRGGVFVVKIENITATAVENADVNVQKQMLYQQEKQKQFQFDPIAALKNSATIRDYRSKFY